MIEVFKDKELEISFSHAPKVQVRYLLPWVEESEAKDIKEKPFICENGFKILINDKETQEDFTFSIPSNYAWDGASIPRIFWRVIGSKTESDFLIASCVHDFMCENHDVVSNDRNLSSRIFRALLISQGVSKFKAQIMYIAVDNFQRFCGWKN